MKKTHLAADTSVELSARWNSTSMPRPESITSEETLKEFLAYFVSNPDQVITDYIDHFDKACEVIAKLESDETIGELSQLSMTLTS